MEMPSYINISTYKFAPLNNLKPLRHDLLEKCKSWNLKGTILLSTEGINLFVAGNKTEIDLLLEQLKEIEGLKDLTPKISLSEHQPFTRMLVKIKKEIITFGVEGIDPAKHTSRKIAAKTLKKWLDEGCIVLADRYATANQIHQGGKIDDLKKRKEFLAWLYKMEYGVFGIPKPDLVIYLDVPFEVSKMWLMNKVAKRKKKYLNGRKDVAEDNLIHLKNSRNSALLLTKENKNWTKIECCKGNLCMSPEQVGEEVYKIVNKKIK
jgi:thymidylate kinase